MKRLIFMCAFFFSLRSAFAKFIIAASFMWLLSKFICVCVRLCAFVVRSVMLPQRKVNDPSQRHHNAHFWRKRSAIAFCRIDRRGTFRRDGLRSLSSSFRFVSLFFLHIVVSFVLLTQAFKSGLRNENNNEQRIMSSIFTSSRWWSFIGTQSRMTHKLGKITCDYTNEWISVCTKWPHARISGFFVDALFQRYSVYCH